MKSNKKTTRLTLDLERWSLYVDATQSQWTPLICTEAVAKHLKIKETEDELPKFIELTVSTTPTEGALVVNYEYDELDPEFSWDAHGKKYDAYDDLKDMMSKTETNYLTIEIIDEVIAEEG